MSEIVAISANQNNCENIGGVSHAYGIPTADVTAVTVSAGVITGFTLAASKSFSKLEFDDVENVAFFNEEPAEVGSAIEFNGSGLMQFDGIDQAKITAANKAKGCCGSVIVWVHYDGTRRVQGVDVAPDDSWQFSKRKARILPTINSGTGAETSIMQYAVNHVGRYAAATTDLTDTAIEALLGI